MEEKKIEILDEEWQKFLDEEYKQVQYNLPTKKVTERYLNWKAKQSE